MKNPLFVKTALLLLLVASLAAVSHAATTDIAQVPLVTSAPNAVLPKLMFILDDSGSMGWDYLPDYVDDNRCRSSGANAMYSGNFGAACANEPPYCSPVYNGSYYNPAISYMPPLYADGTSWPQGRTRPTRRAGPVSRTTPTASFSWTIWKPAIGRSNWMRVFE